MSSHALPVTGDPAVYIIHDNPEWIAPFTDALDRLGVAHVEWLLPETTIDLAAEPPEGLFWSRLSASAHTRTDPHVKEYGRAVLDWLAAAGRRVINGRDVYELEVSKIRQHRELAGQGFDVPRTAAAFGSRALVEAAAGFTPPFITRAEFIGVRFHYAVRVDVSGGSFELCPADACEVPGAGAGPNVGEVPQFARRNDVTAATPLIARLETLLSGLGIEIAGIEFIETADGRQVVYDINTNTNYNPSVESAELPAGRQPAVDRIAQYVSDTLAEAAPQSVSPAGPAAR